MSSNIPIQKFYIGMSFDCIADNKKVFVFAWHSATITNANSSLETIKEWHVYQPNFGANVGLKIM